MSAAGFALILRPDTSFQIIEWPRESAAGLRSLYTEIGCTNVAVVDLSLTGCSLSVRVVGWGSNRVLVWVSCRVLGHEGRASW